MEGKAPFAPLTRYNDNKENSNPFRQNFPLRQIYHQNQTCKNGQFVAFRKLVQKRHFTYAKNRTFPFLATRWENG